MSLSGPLFRASTLLLAVFLVLLVAACDSPEEKEARHLARGIEFAEAGDDAKAMVEFRNVLRLNAKNAEALYEVGLIHERAERWVQAFNAFQAAAAEQPGYIDANLKIGTLALLSNEVEIAEKAAADILAVHPGNPDAEVLDAAVLLRRGDLERALTLAEGVLDRDPRQEKGIAVVVGVLQARGRADEAVARIDQALALMPDNINLRALKIALFEQSGDVEGARATYDELVALEPGNVGHRLALAGFLDRQFDPIAAETVLREAMNRDIQAGGGLGESLVGLVYRERGAAAAEAELERLIGLEPGNSRYLFLLAELLTQQQRSDDAEKALRAIVEGGDEEAGLDAKAAIALLRLGAEDTEGAGSMAEDVLAKDKDHRGANFVRGLAHLAENNPDDAIRSARTALRRDPAWTPALKLVAEAHLRKGETDLAVSALGEVVSLDPRDVSAGEALAELLTQRGDLDTALKVWDQLLETSAEPSTALQARAQIRLQQENWTAAEADIERLLEISDQEVGVAVLAGTLDLVRSRYDRSREWFGKALDLQPDAAGPVVGIVRARLAEGNVDAALDFLEERTKARPEDALALQMKGELLARQGEPDAASEALEAAIAVRADWPLPYRQLAALKRELAGDVDAAVAVYERALAAMPENAEIQGDLAATLMIGDRPREAMAAYRRLHQLQPGNEDAANNYAALVADHAHDDAEALDHALAVAERFRISANGLFLDTLGWLHYRKGDYPMAATYLERAVAQIGDNPQLRYHLGMALEAAGQTERARLELQRAAVEGADYHGLDEARATLAALEAAAAAAAGG